MRTSRLGRALAALALAGLLCPLAWAATAAELAREGRQLYQAARFVEAQESLREALGRPGLGPHERAQAQFLLGLVYLAQGYETHAIEAMVAARQADPRFEPPAAELSPRALEIWDLSAPEGQRRPRPVAPAPTEAPPAAMPLPAPTLRETPLFDPGPGIRETPIAEPSPRIYDLRLAHGVKGGRPVGVTQVFAPSVKRIHLWFAMENVPKGAHLRAVWSYLGTEPMQIMSTEMEVARPGSWGQFSCEMGTGYPWPAGRYRVELFLGHDLAGWADFEVP